MSQHLERRGTCRRCGLCCIKSRAQPHVWDDRDNIPGPPREDRCPALIDEPDGTTSCATYEDRPTICREFPRTRWDLRNIEGCGYYFIQVKDNGETSKEGEGD